MKSTKLTYEEYKAFEQYVTGESVPDEFTERTAEEGAFRKTFVLNLAGRELRFVGPWVTYALKAAEGRQQLELPGVSISTEQDPAPVAPVL